MSDFKMKFIMNEMKAVPWLRLKTKFNKKFSMKEKCIIISCKSSSTIIPSTKLIKLAFYHNSKVKV